jgi:hypothetical protein
MKQALLSKRKWPDKNLSGHKKRRREEMRMIIT